MDEITFIIPIRIDCIERLNNLDYVIWYLQSNFNAKIIIAEDDSESKLSHRYSNIQYNFLQNDSQIFHRTRILNYMTKLVNTKYICVYDADIILPLKAYTESLNLLSEFDFIYPYNRTFIEIPNYYTQNKVNIDFNNIKESELLTDCSLGGAFYAKTDVYKNAGMENENFISWGFEDNERFDRFLKLGYNVGFNPNHCLCHFKHPRGINSWVTNPFIEKNKQEFIKVKSMSKEQLINYISTWNWNKI